MAADSADRSTVVDFAAAKRRLGDPARPVCPKCGKRITRGTTRCPHCGVWFSAALSGRESRFDWRALARRIVVWALFALLAALTLIGVYATFFAPAGGESGASTAPPTRPAP